MTISLVETEQETYPKIKDHSVSSFMQCIENFNFQKWSTNLNT